MSVNKKKRNIKKTTKQLKNFTILGIGIAVLLIVLLLYLVFANRGDYYKVDSRVDKVDSSKKFKDTDYRTIAWLRVQGTKIDLPIIHSDDPTKEFPVDVEKFAWSENEDVGFHNMIRIQGHNVFNLSSHPEKSGDNFTRFEELMSFIYYDFAKDNKYIQYTIDGKDYVYKIFSTSFVSKAKKTFTPDEDDVSKKTIKTQIEGFKENSIYDYDVDVNENDKIITLATCTRFYGPNDGYYFYVVGRLLRDGEKIDNYKVTKNKSYNKIEKILKGDEENEEDNA